MKPFFNIRPRRFNHVPIYSDERTERLRAIEERARRELGMSVEGDAPRRDFHGVFSSGSSRRRPSGGGNAGLSGISPFLIRIVIIAVLSALACWLLTDGLLSY